MVLVMAVASGMDPHMFRGLHILGKKRFHDNLETYIVGSRNTSRTKLPQWLLAVPTGMEDLASHMKAQRPLHLSPSDKLFQLLQSPRIWNSDLGGNKLGKTGFAAIRNSPQKHRIVFFRQ